MVGGGFFVVRGVVTGLLVVACVEDVLAVVVSFDVAGKVGDAVRERRIASVRDSFYLLQYVMAAKSGFLQDRENSCFSTSDCETGL